MKRRGSAFPLGEEHPLHVLTGDEVLAIRARRGAGESLPALAHDFGVAVRTIEQIVKRITWRHLPEVTETTAAA